jgi:hypothetical protein
MTERISVVVLVLLLLGACTSSPPKRPDNICAVFQEKPGWYKAARRAEKRWGMPIPVGMAFIHKESSYQAKARPERTKLLWIIPWTRPSSAYGYAQATDDAWADYRKEHGGWLSERHDMEDALDFIGWYNNRSHKQLGLPKTDAFSLYIAYYTGIGGYSRGGWRGNETIKGYARRVSDKAYQYGQQLRGCEKKLKRSRWFF